MLSNILFYNFFFILSLVIAYFYELTRKKIFTNLLLFILFIFCGLRYKVGNDYESYQNIFYAIKSGFESYVEPGFYLLNIIFSKTNNGFYYVFGIVSFVTIYLYLRALIKFRVVLLGVFFLFTAEYLFFINDIIRQGLAIAIFLNLISAISSNKTIKIYIIVLISTFTIHYSAIVLLLVNFLKRIKVNNLVWAVLITLSAILYFLGYFKNSFPLLIGLIPYYGERYLVLQEGEFLDNVELGSGLGVLFKYITYMFVAVYSTRQKNDIIFNLFMFGCVLQFVFLDYFLPLRVLEYFLYLKLILYSVLVKYEWDLKKSIIFIILHIIYFEYLLIVSGGKHGGFPYNNILLNI